MIKYIVIDDEIARTNYLRKGLKENEKMVFLFPDNKNYEISDSCCSLKNLQQLKNILEREIKDSSFLGVSIIYDVNLLHNNISTLHENRDYFDVLAGMFLYNNTYFVNSSSYYGKRFFDEMVEEKYSVTKNEIDEKSDQVPNIEDKDDASQMMDRIRNYFKVKPDFEFTDWFKFGTQFSSPEDPTRGPGHALGQYKKGDSKIDEFVETLCRLLDIGTIEFYDIFPIENLYSQNGIFNNQLVSAIKYTYDRDFCLETYGVLFSVVSYLNKVIANETDKDKALKLKNKTLSFLKTLFINPKGTEYSFSFQFDRQKALERLSTIFDGLLNDLIYNEGETFTFRNLDIVFNEATEKTEEQFIPNVLITLDFDLGNKRTDFFSKLKKHYAIAGKIILKLNKEKNLTKESNLSEEAYKGNTTTRNLISFCILNNSLKENGQEFVSYRFVNDETLRVTLKGYDFTTIRVV